MPRSPFVSFAMDCEDVVLWRALSAQRPARYVEVAPTGPAPTSPVRSLHDAGWHGVLVVDPGAVEAARTLRPGALVLDALEDLVGTITRVHVAVAPDLGTAQRLVAALPAAPWVLHVTSRDHDGALDVHGYVPVLTIGDVHLLVAQERESELRPHLSAPPSSRDGFVRGTEVALRAERDAALESLMRWRAQALVGWPGGSGGADTGAHVEALQNLTEHLTGEIDALHRTVSWRVTSPLRSVYRASATVRHIRTR